LEAPRKVAIDAAIQLASSVDRRVRYLRCSRPEKISDVVDLAHKIVAVRIADSIDITASTSDPRKRVAEEYIPPWTFQIK
jgi:hypothetical protein